MGVEADLAVNLPVLAAGAYGFGKQIARLAQLAHIADVVGEANGRKIKVLTSGVGDGKNGTNTQKANPSSSSASVPSDTMPAEVNGGTTRRAYALLEKYLTMWLTGYDNEK